MGKGSAECNRDCIICGSIGAVCILSGSGVSGIMVLMWAMIRLSKHFMTTEVSAMGSFVLPPSHKTPEQVIKRLL